MGTPVPEKQCENRPVMLPRVKCEEVVEKRCFQLPSADLDSTTLEKCSTQLGAPKCRQVPVKLPRQVCSRVIPVPKPAPVVHHAVHQPVVDHAVHQPVLTAPPPWPPSRCPSWRPAPAPPARRPCLWSCP